jgi:hypothetical protein
LEKIGVFHGLKDYNSRPKKLNGYPFKTAKSPHLYFTHTGLYWRKALLEADAPNPNVKPVIDFKKTRPLKNLRQ